jgi:hypothetical protein
VPRFEEAPRTDSNKHDLEIGFSDAMEKLRQLEIDIYEVLAVRWKCPRREAKDRVIRLLYGV